MSYPMEKLEFTKSGFDFLKVKETFNAKENYFPEEVSFIENRKYKDKIFAAFPECPRFGAQRCLSLFANQ